MHDESAQFVENVRQRIGGYFFAKKVLEVGSLDINGSVRSQFSLCDFCGIDLGPGKGVDQVCDIIDFKGEDYDVVISCEMLEHDWHWHASLWAMYNILKDGGLLIITCAGPDRPEHGTNENHPEASPYTNEYYRNLSIEDFIKVFPSCNELFNHWVLQYARGRNDLQFYGIKRNSK